MPKLRNEVSATGQAGSLTAIAASQSLAGAGALSLNGPLAVTNYPLANSANVTEPGGPFSPSQILAPSGGQPIAGNAVVLSPPQSVVIASAGDDAGINWTVKGFDYGGSPLTEVIAGGNIGNATTGNQFAVVTSISASGATASTVTAGTGAVIYSPWLILGSQRNNYTTNLRAFLSSGAANFDVQATSDINLMNNTGGFADDIITLQAAQTASITTPLVETYMGVRVKINSGTGTVILRALESRTA